jgi:BirA family biotin operon repressor/biotin-[acetyl-CoA-carboxylase] ligase
VHAQPVIPLDRDAILGHLEARRAGFAIEVLPECESTNTLLMARPGPGDGPVAVVLAERQTAGRGRRGRSWLAWPGASLTFSTRWSFPPGAPVPAGLSLVVGLAVVNALEGLGVEGLALKWPNDILLHGCKLGGILVELTSGRGRPHLAVIGIGLNIDLPPETRIPGQAGVASLRQALAAVPDRNLVAARLLGELEDLLTLYAVAGFDALRPSWMQRNAHANLPVRLESEGMITEGVCRGVDQDGALLLETPGGVERVLSGEVSLRGVA